MFSLISNFKIQPVVLYYSKLFFLISSGIEYVFFIILKHFKNVNYYSVYILIYSNYIPQIYYTFLPLIDRVVILNLK